MKLVTYYTDSHFNLYRNYFIPSIKDNFEVFQKCGNQVSLDGSYFNEGFSETTKNKIEFLLESLEHLNEDEVVLFSDVDIIFLSPVKEYLDQYIEYDMVFQEGFGGLNTGFFIMKNKKPVRDLLKSVIYNCHLYHDDQVTLNYLIRDSELKYTTFDYRIMSPATIIGPRIWENQLFDIPQDALVFHACWCAGVENKTRLLEHVRQYRNS